MSLLLITLLSGCSSKLPPGAEDTSDTGLAAQDTDSGSAPVDDSDAPPGDSEPADTGGGGDDDTDTGDTAPPAEDGLCDGADPRGLPFIEGSGSLTTGDVVADFTLPTLDGDWTLSEQWTGCDSLLFINYRADWEYSVDMWSTLDEAFFELAPENLHVFVMSYQESDSAATAEVKDLRAVVEEAMEDLSDEDRARWSERFHYVTTGTWYLGNIVADKFTYYSGLSAAIDRHQQWRDVGMLQAPGYGGFVYDLNLIANEARYYDFEWERERAQEAEDAEAEVTVVTLTSGESIYASYLDVELPDAEAMAGFTRLELDMTQWCSEDPNSWTCGEWDYNAQLYLCDEDDPGTDEDESESCPTLFARWITSYGRSGRWVWDVSPMLGLIPEGGARRFYLANANTYTTDLQLRFSAEEEAPVPFAAEYLFSGGGFNESYNEGREPLTFTVPEGATRVELVALITGHGYGVEVENCAEFCDHEHEFTVNELATYTRDHPEAGQTYGCMDRTGEGVVPNQYGTWWYGRGGWCPGYQVDPWVVDITGDVTLDGENTISYRGLFEGEDYVPEASGGSSGFAANIYMDSWLVFSR
jgi:hypothetical protein